MPENKKTNYHYALGRRKTAIAKVRLFKGSGKITINHQPAEDYFDGNRPLVNELSLPLIILSQINSYDISVITRGGGHHAQAGAIRLGIAKALIALDPESKDTLRQAKLLGRDSRAKERKKFGKKGARKKRQFTKR